MELTVTDNKVFIPKSDINETHSLALRVFDSKGKQIAYKSTRLGTITADNNGVSFHCENELIGCDFEIKDLQNSKATVTGKLVKQKAAKTTVEKETKKDE